MPGPARRDRLRQVCRRRDRRVGSRPAQMSAMATASALGEDLGELAEHRRGPMVGERLVDRPDRPPGFALADGRERLADRGRVMAVVVVDDDAGRLALALEAPADAGERREVASRSSAGATPRAEAAPATASAFAALCRPAVASGPSSGPASGSSPWISSGRRRGVGGGHPAEQRRRGSGAVANRSAMARAYPPSRCGAWSTRA